MNLQKLLSHLTRLQKQSTSDAKVFVQIDGDDIPISDVKQLVVIDEGKLSKHVTLTIEV